MKSVSVDVGKMRQLLASLGVLLVLAAVGALFALATLGSRAVSADS